MKDKKFHDEHDMNEYDRAIVRRAEKMIDCILIGDDDGYIPYKFKKPLSFYLEDEQRLEFLKSQIKDIKLRHVGWKILNTNLPKHLL